MNKELKIDIPEGYEIDKENSTFERIVFKKKSTYPKSWEEFCENNKITNKEYFIGTCSTITSIYSRTDRAFSTDRNLCKTEEEAEAFLALIQLKRLWHEYVDNYSEKVDAYYCIDPSGGSLLHSISSNEKDILKFPSRKLAQEFLNNFKDLIIKAGPLWK